MLVELADVERVASTSLTGLSRADVSWLEALWATDPVHFSVWGVLVDMWQEQVWNGFVAGLEVA